MSTRAANAKRARTGLSLVEVMLMISVAAIVLAAAGPAFFRAVRLSKVDEAPHQLQRLQARVQAYYATPQPTAAGARLSCLPQAAGPAPALPAEQPMLIVLAAPETPGAATWQALGFEPDGPIRFRYSVLPSAAGCDSNPHASASVVLRAEGDLDNDGALSMFERTVNVIDGEWVPDPLLFVRDRTE